jgi:glycosyltransferase involved in cell wall biosynthesis
VGDVLVIDILVPVRDRPQNVKPLIESIRENTETAHRVVFLVHPDDRDEIFALHEAEAIFIRSPEHSYAYKINLGVKLTKAEFVFLGADDLRFHPGWDVAAIDRFDETQKPVIGTNDLGNATVMAGKHTTHSLVHHSYFEQGTATDPDCLLHEGYIHNWVDTEFVETAMKRKAFVFCAESKVEHLHPFWHKGENDHIYELGRQGYGLDRRLYLKRRRFWR